MRELGFQGATLFADFWIWGDTLGDGRAIGADLAATDMRLASVVTRVDTKLDRYRRLADVVRSLDSVHLVVIGGGGHTDQGISRLAGLLDRIGAVTRDRGIRLSYHHHTDTIGEGYEAVRKLLDRTDPEAVGLDFDVGHATKDFTELPIVGRAQTAFDAFRDRVVLVELKDWTAATDLDTAVGDGTANVPAFLRRLSDARYRDWLIVEQNDDIGRSPDEKLACARRSLRAIAGGTL